MLYEVITAHAQRVEKLYQGTDRGRKPGFTLFPDFSRLAVALLALLAALPLPAEVDPGVEFEDLREAIRVEIEQP